MEYDYERDRVIQLAAEARDWAAEQKRLGTYREYGLVGGAESPGHAGPWPRLTDERRMPRDRTP